MNTLNIFGTQTRKLGLGNSAHLLRYEGKEEYGQTRTPGKNSELEVVTYGRDSFRALDTDGVSNLEIGLREHQGVNLLFISNRATGARFQDTRKVNIEYPLGKNDGTKIKDSFLWPDSIAKYRDRVSDIAVTRKEEQTTVVTARQDGSVAGAYLINNTTGVLTQLEVPASLRLDPL